MASNNNDVFHTDLASGLDPELSQLATQVVTYDRDGRPLSFVFSESWDYSHSHPHLSSEAVVNFPKEYRADIQRIVYLINCNSLDMSPKSIRTEVGALGFIANAIGTTDLHVLERGSEYRRLLDALSGMSVGTVERYLGVINKAHSAGLTDCRINQVRALAERIGSPAEQHICLPEGFASRFCLALIEYVQIHHPYRHQISNAYAAKLAYDDRLLSQGYSPDSLRQNRHRHYLSIDGIKYKIDKIASLHQEVVLNCMMLVMAFTGMRFGEASSLRRNAYFTKSVNGHKLSFVRGETTKANEGLPLRVDWVTHPIVKDALELAYDSTQWARCAYIRLGGRAQREAEFCFIKPFGHRGDGLKFSTAWFAPSAITKRSGTFCETNKIGLTVTDVNDYKLVNPSRPGQFVAGEYPSFSSHTFRRTFAVFLCRNQIGSLYALKGQYKHLNAFMTKWYTNNADLARALDLKLDERLAAEIKLINEEVTAHMLFDILNSDSLSGDEGERIIASRAKGGHLTLTKEEILAKVRSGAYALVEHPTGYCLNPRCERICNSDLSTFTCTHEVTTREKAIQRLPERERLISEFQKANTGQIATYGLLKHYQMKIEAISVTLSKHGIEVEPFRDTIKARSLLILPEERNESK